MADTYPAKYKTPARDTIIDPSTCYNRECTSYCAWKISEATGKWPKRTGDMNAYNWIKRLAENGYKTTVSAPKSGGKYVGVLGAYKGGAGKYGHVVWSEGTLTVSEYNWGDHKGAYGIRTVNAQTYTWVQIKAPQSSPQKPTGSFLPAKGYWAIGDKDARIGTLATWMRKTFPAYTPASALGNYYGQNIANAIKEFQKRTGLKPDGMTGALTYEQLKKHGFKA